MKQYMEKDIEKYVTTRQNLLEYKRFQELFLIDIIGYEAYANMKSSLFSEMLFSKITIHTSSLFQFFLGISIITYGCFYIFSEKSLESISFSLLCLAFGVGFVYTGYKSFRRIAVYKKTLHYLESKDSIVNEGERLKITIQKDIENTGIDPGTVFDIKKYIVSILSGYQVIAKSHEYIQNHRGYFGKISQEGQDVINRELQWIVSYTQEFTTLIQSWISHHTTELAELEKQIESQELVTENIGGKGALGLQRMSLQEHLKELEKVRV